MSDLVEIYNKIAEDYADTRVQGSHQKMVDGLTKLLPQGKIIEIGSGPGFDARLLRAAGYDYHGIDFSPGMIEVARRSAPDATFELMDFTQPTFDDEVFDGFWAIASYVHTPKEEMPTSLIALKRILKNGAIGVISMKDKGISWEGIVKEDRFGKGMVERYFSYYTIPELTALLHENGLKVVGTDLLKHDEPQRPTSWQIYYVQVEK